MIIKVDEKGKQEIAKLMHWTLKHLGYDGLKITNPVLNAMKMVTRPMASKKSKDKKNGE